MYLRDSPHKKMSSRSAKIRRISETLFSTRNAYETVLRFSRLAERIDLERVPNRSSGPPVVAVRSSNRQPLHHPKLLPLREKTIWVLLAFPAEFGWGSIGRKFRPSDSRFRFHDNDIASTIRN